MSQKKVLGLVTCYNRKEKTTGSIKRLIDGNRDVSFEFIVVDGGSTDGTVEALQAFPNVSLIRPKDTVYYSGGMRLAIDKAKEVIKYGSCFDFILLFNDDVEFYDDAVQSLISRYDAYAHRCVWIGPTDDGNGVMTYGGVKRTSHFRASTELVKGMGKGGALCDSANANCILVDKDMFIACPNMDSVYSHSLGDFDYGFEITRRGFEIRAADIFVGKCLQNDDKGTWKDTSLPRSERIRLKESPKGLPRKEWFHFLKKNYGLIQALYGSVTPYIRVLIGK